MPTRTICISGAARGLGRALWRGFAQLGWDLAACVRSAEDAQALLEEARSLQPHRAPRALAHIADVADPAAIAAFSKAVLCAQGSPDLLINNAAVINANAPLWEIPAADFDHLMAVNVSGTANMIRAFTPAMIARGSGIIANVSSGWGRSTSPLVAPYCASKWAVEGLTQALAQELPTGLAAVAVNPGIIATDMLRLSFGPDADSYPTPEAWARRAIPFLANLTPAHNGQALTIP
jgi:NAD(P)-dependent dehydrogenase (short-subunit alcohol dehydrogenase family)